MHCLIRWRLATVVASAALLLGAAVGAQAQINVATGLDASNNLITTGGAPDAHWTVDLAAGGTGAAQVVEPSSADWYGGWLANGPDSDWIARNANVQDNGAAPYTFYRTFDLTGYDLSTVAMSGSWAIDDTGTLNLNGNNIATLGSGAWGGLTPFSVATGSPLFHTGLNTLTITMTSDDRFLEAVRLQGAVTGSLAAPAVPEPGAPALCLAALGALTCIVPVRRLARR